MSKKELPDSEKIKGKENLTLNIIQDKVSEGEIDLGKIDFTTWQDKKNDAGEVIGTVRMVLIEGEDEADTEYICPRCQHHGFKKVEYKRPLWVKCDNCEKSFTVPRMKSKVKRQTKKGPDV